MVRLSDIAKEAGVSLSAASFALNHKAGVSDEVRRRIIEIAARRGYRNAGLREEPAAAVTVKFLKIAVHGHIVNERHNAFITEYMEGIETAARKRKFTLEVSFFDQVPVPEIVAAQKESGARGFLILGTELGARDLASFAALARPMVFLDSQFPVSLYDCVDMDNRDGVFKAVEYLVACGHRDIGLVKSGYETGNFKLREFGFREAMDYFSLPVENRQIVSVDPAFTRANLDMAAFLDRRRDAALPSAFFCMNDIIACGCVKALRDHGRRVPEDVSVIGFDDLPSSGFSEPPLTTIRVSTRQIGRRALEKLAERIDGDPEQAPEDILIAGKLVVRESVRRTGEPAA